MLLCNVNNLNFHDIMSNTNDIYQQIAQVARPSFYRMLDRLPREH